MTTLSLKTWGQLNPVRRTPLLASIRTEISRFFPHQFAQTISIRSDDDPLKSMNERISDGSFVHANIGLGRTDGKKKLYFFPLKM